MGGFSQSGGERSPGRPALAGWAGVRGGSRFPPFWGFPSGLGLSLRGAAAGISHHGRFVPKRRLTGLKSAGLSQSGGQRPQTGRLLRPDFPLRHAFPAYFPCDSRGHTCHKKTPNSGKLYPAADEAWHRQVKSGLNGPTWTDLRRGREAAEWNPAQGREAVERKPAQGREAAEWNPAEGREAAEWNPAPGCGAGARGSPADAKGSRRHTSGAARHTPGAARHTPGAVRHTTGAARHTSGLWTSPGYVDKCALRRLACSTRGLGRWRTSGPPAARKLPTN